MFLYGSWKSICEFYFDNYDLKKHIDAVHEENSISIVKFAVQMWSISIKNFHVSWFEYILTFQADYL